MIKNFKWLLLVSLTFAACSDDEDGTTIADEPITAGTADFSKYVALGNSLTAGFSDNALFRAGQENSYPNIMSQQFALAGGGNFTIPYTSDNLGGLLAGGFPIQNTRLFLNGFATTTSPNIVTVPGVPTTDILNVLTGPFNSMGVPGAKSFHLLAPGYGNIAGVGAGAANPYFVRFASTPSASIIGDAVAQNPTFFSLWIGNNDVLSYATSGGIGVDQAGNLNPATYGGNDITDPNVFANVYNTLLTSLTANGAKGVVANIPYVTSVPFFTTVPVKPVAPSAIFNDSGEFEEDNKTNPPVSPSDIATIDAINASVYGPMKQILTLFGQGDRLNLLSATAANPVLIRDETLTDLSAQITAAASASGNPQLMALAPFLGPTFGQVRQTKAGDFILLPTRSIIGTAAPLPAGIPANLGVYGITFPLADKDILIPFEVNSIKMATDAYNVTIQTLAAEKGLAFVDANLALRQIFSPGIRFGNHQLSAAFITGGVFSLDGVHPGARGYAYIANQFLLAINATYGSNFKGVDLKNYPIQYPQSLD